MRHPFAVRRIRTAVAFAMLALFVLPAVVLAHAELEKATPKDGATVEGTPAEISGMYSESMDPKGSSLRLLDAAGTELAKGGVDPDDAKRMVITDLPELAPGTYTVKSTSKSAEDGDIDRKEWTFTVVAAPTPSPSPPPTPTAPPSATPAATPTSEPTPVCTDFCAGQSTDGTTPTQTTAPTANATPTPAPSAGGSDTSGGGDVLLPIVAAVVIVAVIAGFLFSRRDRPPTQT
jgi:methionine-rich copper-binding protein CopC